MPTVDPRHILTVLAKRAPQSVMVAADLCLLSRDRVRDERYSAERTKEEDTNIDAACVDSLVTAEADAARAIDEACAAALKQHADEDRARATERRQLRDVIDVQSLRESDDPDEILRLVGDAEAVGGDVVGEQARAVAVKRLRALAKEEVQHQNGRAFAAWCALTQQSGAGTRRTDVAARYEQQRRELRDVVVKVANALGLAEQFRRATLRATVPQPPELTTKPTFVIGRFWESERAKYVRQLREKQKET